MSSIEVAQAITNFAKFESWHLHRLTIILITWLLVSCAGYASWISC